MKIMGKLVVGTFLTLDGDTQLATTGAVLHVYERAGALRYGEAEVGQEMVIFDSDKKP